MKKIIILIGLLAGCSNKVHQPIQPNQAKYTFTIQNNDADTIRLYVFSDSELYASTDYKTLSCTGIPSDARTYMILDSGDKIKCSFNVSDLMYQANGATVINNININAVKATNFYAPYFGNTYATARIGFIYTKPQEIGLTPEVMPIISPSECMKANENDYILKGTLVNYNLITQLMLGQHASIAPCNNGYYALSDIQIN